MAEMNYRYQLTINNPLSENRGWTHEKIFEVLTSRFKTLTYACLADEQGSTFHTHIFVIFRSRVRFEMVKKYFPEAHIEVAHGTISDNVLYIKKEGKWLDDVKHGTKIEGSFEEWGKQPPDSKGIRTDMSELYYMIAVEELSNSEILSINQDYILQIDKLDKVRTTVLMERYKDTVRLNLKVVYVCGATGTGKTRGVLEKHGYSNVYRITDYKHPFDGYNCQPVIAFDEFRDSLRLTQMLNYCDIYPIQLECRYSNKFACYDHVYIISNWELSRQYIHEQSCDNESWKAFLRRIHEVIVYEKDGKIKKYASVDDYFNKHECPFDNDTN